MRIFNTLVAALALTAGSIASAQAADFPEKPVTIVMPFPAGTGPDAVMRMVADKLTTYWKQPVTIENRPGANYWTAAGAVKKAAADGYTLLQGDNLMMGLQPHVFKKLPFDPVQDFEPVASMYQTNFFIVVPVDSPWKSIPDLVAAAKASDGGLTYGSSGVASHMHLGGLMLENSEHIKMTHVPVKETPQVFVSVANGELSFAFGSAPSSGAMLRANKVKYLALAAPKRNAQFPDVPTVAEAGGPENFELKSWIALFAPHGTPKETIEKLNADITRALNEPDVSTRITDIGFTPWTSTAQQLGETLADDTATLGDLAKSQNISLD